MYVEVYMNHTTWRLMRIMAIVPSVVLVIVACSSVIARIPITSNYAYAASHCKTYKSANGQDGIHCSATNGEVCTNYGPKNVVCTNGNSQSSPPDISTNQPNSLSPPMTNPPITSSDPGTTAGLSSNDHG